MKKNVKLISQWGSGIGECQGWQRKPRSSKATDGMGETVCEGGVEILVGVSWRPPS